MTPERAVEVLQETMGILVLIRNASKEDPTLKKMVTDYSKALPIAIEAIEMQNDRLKIEGEQ